MHSVTDEQLRVAVAASRSWRGVLRTVGLTSPRTGRELKARCDVLGIDYSHFGKTGPEEDTLRAAIQGCETWPEVLTALGFAPHSGSARASLRRHCAALGVET